MKNMGLINCYECGKEISDKAPSCPHCGAPKLVAANKEVKIKKSLVFSKYLKPIGIGLGVIFLPLAAVASVTLIQADGNVDAVVWRFKNKKFIDSRCTFPHREKTALPKKCRSLIYKLGEKSENVAWSSHNACMSEKRYENPKVYDKCIKRWDRIYRERSKPLDQFTHKGKTYTASRRCPLNQNMYWSITTGVMRKTKVSELGCMTKAQNEAFWRNYNLRKAGAPKGNNGNSSNWYLQQQINQNRFNDIHRHLYGY